MKAMLTTLAVLVAIAPAAAASEGVIEINQARALAGGVTPGDAPGFPVTIDRFGSYRLTSDLFPAQGAVAIDVSGPNVTLDLNGFGVFAGGAQGAIQASGPMFDLVNGAVVGNITTWGEGARVERVRVSLGSIYLWEGMVSGCTVRRSLFDAITVGERGLVTGNVVTDSAGHGLVLGGNVGYSGNVVVASGGGAVTGGRSLGGNLCQSVGC